MNLNYKIKKRKKALETINELVNNASHLLLIHYSCESFYNVEKWLYTKGYIDSSKVL